MSVLTSSKRTSNLSCGISTDSVGGKGIFSSSAQTNSGSSSTNSCQQSFVNETAFVKSRSDGAFLKIFSKIR